MKLNVTFTKRGYSKQLSIPPLLSDDSQQMSIAQIWSNYNFSDDYLLHNMVHAILDTNNIFTSIVSTSVCRCNTEIVNLRRGLATLQKCLERHPTSSMILCDW